MNEIHLPCEGLELESTTYITQCFCLHKSPGNLQEATTQGYEPYSLIVENSLAFGRHEIYQNQSTVAPFYLQIGVLGDWIPVGPGDNSTYEVCVT